MFETVGEPLGEFAPNCAGGEPVFEQVVVVRDLLFHLLFRIPFCEADDLFDVLGVLGVILVDGVLEG